MKEDKYTFRCKNCKSVFVDKKHADRKFCSRKCSTEDSLNPRVRVTDNRRNYDDVAYFALPGLMSDVNIRFKPTSGSLGGIMEAVSNETKIPIEKIMGTDRKRPVVKARHLFFYLAKKYSGCSLSKIGDTCDRDHTTVIHGARATTQYIRYEDDLKDTLRKIEMTLV